VIVLPFAVINDIVYCALLLNGYAVAPFITVMVIVAELPLAIPTDPEVQAGVVPVAAVTVAVYPSIVAEDIVTVAEPVF